MRETLAADDVTRSLRFAEDVCVDFARKILPAHVQGGFNGRKGRYALTLIACGSSLAAHPDLQRSVGVNEWRAMKWLAVQPAFWPLVELYQSPEPRHF
ncbi:hypothetical protein [Trinickia mobilis]|uniref:hypothetical protein n=1 Tax=Trinickia mobilis TaxID=2816356 RepID=UPI001A8DC5E9|nr:hypothetical protein [Trinickia mobilis]